jgi:hypothetical protein
MFEKFPKCSFPQKMSRRARAGTRQLDDDRASQESFQVGYIPPTPASPVYRQPVIDFFCNVRCACNESSRYKRLLVLTSLPFSVPMWLLLRQGTYLLGYLAAMLTATSVIYHSSHSPLVRAADVLLVWTTGAVGAVYGVVGLLESTSCLEGFPFALALCGLAFITLINASKRFYTPDGRLIALHWHACVHLLTAASLAGVAIGRTTKPV